jgi:hypothetical protein
MVREMHRTCLVVFATALACPSPAGAGGAATPAETALFSNGVAGSAVASDWKPIRLSDDKPLTTYDLVEDGGSVVLHARAEASASALGHLAGFDVRETPVVKWRWKISKLIDGADNSVASKEDAPARLLFAFAGDKSKLPARDRAVFRLSKRFSGRELPYATLMYVWANQAAPGTVIENPHTRRIQMIVASSGDAGAGQWQTLSRNLYADYKTAFGEEPGKLIAYGVMSDADNTGASVEAWYGDIVFAAESH